MDDQKKIKNALISVYSKDFLEPVVRRLHELGVTLFSTGGTQKFIEELNINVVPVEDLTGYPSILGGRVKTLHPKVFGGILGRRELREDLDQLDLYEIPPIDLVIVDLYPFEETVARTKNESEIIEKIDIGGISLIRAAAKNFKDVVIVSSKNQYSSFLTTLLNENGCTDLSYRKRLATEAFSVSSHYDTAIFSYFNRTENLPIFKQSLLDSKVLRYGENPHQKGIFYGKLDDHFDVLSGKELSYNNLLDIDAGVALISEFNTPTFAIIKHNNACGIASRASLIDAWKDALKADPVSAFGGILVSNAPIDIGTASEIDKLFFEILIAPDFQPAALELLKRKPNRILLRQKSGFSIGKQFRTLLNGVIEQTNDLTTEKISDLKIASSHQPTEQELIDLIFANKIAKHSKSNTIVLAKNEQLFASGVGQTSRVDALKQAIAKAESFGFDLSGAVMASDAFFPFPDCVEIAGQKGIKSVIHPGGSIKDQLSIDYCNAHSMSMAITGNRHFKH